MATNVFGGGFLTQGAKDKSDLNAAIKSLEGVDFNAVQGMQSQAAAGNPVAIANMAKLPNTMSGVGKIAQATAAAGRQAQATNATDSRYGTDLSWLDPQFKQNPTMLGQAAGAGVYASPDIVNAQVGAMNGFQQLANTPMQFQSPAQQQAAYSQWGGIAAGQGAPQFMGNGGQQAVSDQIGSLAGPSWGSDSQQQAVYNGIGNIAAPQWGGAQRQNEVYGQVAGMQGPQFGSAVDQSSIMQDMQERSRGNGAPSFMGDAQARTQYEILSDRGQGVGAPQFMSDQNAQQSYSDLRGRSQGVNEPKFMDGSQQQGVADQFSSIAKSGGGQGLNLDNGANQSEQLGNMREIIAGGGNTAIEAAARQSQRADQEQWLRSQREATQQQYEQRGLTGSGQELMSLGADRQAAAGRNSLADLQTAAALEARRDSTINSAANLSGVMRDQTNASEFAKASRGDQALTNQGAMLNQMRDQDFQGKSYNDSARIQTMLGAADQANAMRSQDFQNKSYLDSSALSATQSAAQQANAMRGQDFQNKSYLDQAEMQSRADAGGMANQLRGDAYNEGMGRTQTQLAQLQMQMQIANQQRADTYNEQAFSAQNSLAKYGMQGDMANAMRNNTYQEQAFGAQNSLAKLQTQADLATAMRQGTYQELGYNDQRALTGLTNQTSLANQMRSDQYGESVAQRTAQQNALLGYGNQANSLRQSSDQNAQYRANSADQFSIMNNQSLNNAEAQNKQFLQTSYQSMMNNRQDWEKNALNVGVGVAQGTKQFDADQNSQAHGAAAGFAKNDAATFNTAQQGYTGAVIGQGIVGNYNTDAAHTQFNTDTTNGIAAVGDAFGMAAQASAGGPGGAAGGSAPKSLASTPGTTWAGAGAPIDQNKNRFY